MGATNQDVSHRNVPGHAFALAGVFFVPPILTGYLYKTGLIIKVNSSVIFHRFYH